MWRGREFQIRGAQTRKAQDLNSLYQSVRTSWTNDAAKGQ